MGQELSRPDDEMILATIIIIAIVFSIPTVYYRIKTKASREEAQPAYGNPLAMARLGRIK